MEIPKEELESFVKEQFENAFAFSLLTKDGMVITKYGDKYYMESSAEAGEAVLGSIGKIFYKTNQ